MSVAARGLDIERLILNLKDGHIKGATSKVKNQDILLISASLVEPIGNRRGIRLVYDSFDSQLGNLRGVLCRLPLLVVEVCWNCDDYGGLGHVLAQELLDCRLQVREDVCRNLLRMVLLYIASLVCHIDQWLVVVSFCELKWPVFGVFHNLKITELSTDESLGIIDESGVLDILTGRNDCALADHVNFLFQEKCDIGRCCQFSVVVGNNLDLAVPYDANTRIRSTQINADCNLAIINFNF